jgi:DNA-3-methyladenine glycosylase I
MKILVTTLLAPSLTRHHRPFSSLMSTLPEKSYCASAKGHEWHGPYHDKEYGFPIRDDDSALFERLVLEINQAGLSWLTILKKREGIREAYADFGIDAVANFTADDEAILRNNSNIIRNKLKIKAAIYNANAIKGLQKSYGSFQAWLDHNHPLSKTEWVALFKKTFKFTGGEITKEFLVSLGYLPGAHHPNCSVYKDIKNAPWMSVDTDFNWK